MSQDANGGFRLHRERRRPAAGFRDADPGAGRLITARATRTIVGIAHDVKNTDLRGADEPEYYFSLAQEPGCRPPQRALDSAVGGRFRRPRVHDPVRNRRARSNPAGVHYDNATEPGPTHSASTI